MGAAALTVTGCPSDDTGSDGTTGSDTDPTTNPSTTMSGSGTSPSTTDSSTTQDPETDSSTGTAGSSETGEPETGSSSGSGGMTDTDTDATGSGSSSSGGAAVCTDTSIVNVPNHGHEVSFDASMLTPGTPLNNIDIQGASGHPHAISLSADDVDTLLRGGSVTVTSTEGAGHTHDVTVSC
jgi:hypothetical protein